MAVIRELLSRAEIQVAPAVARIVLGTRGLANARGGRTEVMGSYDEFARRHCPLR